MVIEVFSFKEFYDLHATYQESYHSILRNHQQNTNKQQIAKKKYNGHSVTDIANDETIANLKTNMMGISGILDQMSSKLQSTCKTIIEEQYSNVLPEYKNIQKQRDQITKQIKELEKKLYDIENVKKEQWEIDQERYALEDYNDFSEPSHYKEVKHKRPEVAAQIVTLKTKFEKTIYTFPVNLPNWVKFYMENIYEKKSVQNFIVYKLDEAQQESKFATKDENNNNALSNPQIQREVSSDVGLSEKIKQMKDFIKANVSYRKALDSVEESKMVVNELTSTLEALQGELYSSKWVDRPEYEISEERARLEDYNDFTEPAHQKLISEKNENVARLIKQSEKLLSEKQRVNFDQNIPNWVILFITKYADLNSIPASFSLTEFNAMYASFYDELKSLIAMQNNNAKPMPDPSAPPIALMSSVPALPEVDNNAKAIPEPSAPPIALMDSVPVLPEEVKNNYELYDRLVALVKTNGFDIEDVLEDLEDDEFKEFECQGTCSLMLKPVQMISGTSIYNVDEKFAQDVFAKSELHPLTREPITKDNIKHNTYLHKRITTYLESKIALQEALLKPIIQEPIFVDEKTNSNNQEARNANSVANTSSPELILRAMLKNYGQPVEAKKEPAVVKVETAQVEYNLTNNNQHKEAARVVEIKPSKEDLFKQLEKIKAPSTSPWSNFFKNPEEEDVQQEKKQEKKSQNILT